MTRTYALLEVSPETYAEVHTKFRDAGYDHAFDRCDDREVIDMHGVALCVDVVPRPEMDLSIDVEEPNPDVAGGRWFFHVAVVLRRPGKPPMHLRDDVSGYSRNEASVLSRELAEDLACAGLGLVGSRTMSETKRTILERLDRNIKLLLPLVPGKFELRFGTPEPRDDLPQGTPPNMKTMTDIDHVAVTINEADAAGNITPQDFQAPPTWQSSDTSILTVQPSPDGTSADVASTGKLGTAQIRVDGMTADGRPLIGLGDFEVVTSAPTTIVLNFGEAAPK